MKQLSRVIRQVNGAIDAMNKEGAGDLLPSEKKVTRAPLCTLCLLAQMGAKR